MQQAFPPAPPPTTITDLISPEESPLPTFSPLSWAIQWVLSHTKTDYLSSSDTDNSFFLFLSSLLVFISLQFCKLFLSLCLLLLFWTNCHRNECKRRKTHTPTFLVYYLLLFDWLMFFWQSIFDLLIYYYYYYYWVNNKILFNFQLNFELL